MKKRVLLLVFLMVIAGFENITADKTIQSNGHPISLHEMATWRTTYAEFSNIATIMPSVMSISKNSDDLKLEPPLFDMPMSSDGIMNSQLFESGEEFDKFPAPSYKKKNGNEKIFLQNLSFEKKGALYHFPDLQNISHNGLSIIKPKGKEETAELWSVYGTSVFLSSSLMKPEENGTKVSGLTEPTNLSYNEHNFQKKLIIYSNSNIMQENFLAAPELIHSNEFPEIIQKKSVIQSIIYGEEDYQNGFYSKSSANIKSFSQSTRENPSEEQIIYKESSTSTCQQFAAEISNLASPSCGFFTPGYSRNGSFRIMVTDAEGCPGTYTLSVTPVDGSAPDGTTPPYTTVVAYIGFGEGEFLFSNAGVGRYMVEVANTDASCLPIKNPVIFYVEIPDSEVSEGCNIANPYQFVVTETINSPSCPFESPAYSRNGSFIVNVTDGSDCTGTYIIGATPVAGSSPDGSTPPVTTIVKYIGFNEGNFLFNNAGAGQYEVEIELTSGNCANVRNKIIKTITIEDAPPSNDCDIPNPNQFTVSEMINSPSCPFESPAYSRNGSFTISVEDGSGCTGTYTIGATPVAGSSPDGLTPPFTTIVKYIGFNEGNFLFNNAGVGQYEVEVVLTAGACGNFRNKITWIVTVEDAAPSEDCEIPNPYQFVVSETINSPTCPFESPAYSRNGSFIVNVTDGSDCTGTYTIGATPVAGSSPDGSTPPFTTIVKYIGFNEGNFLFNNACVGQYEIEVELTSGNCANVRNKITKTITIEDAPPSNACDIPNPNQFTSSETVNSPTCPFDSPAYSRNGSITIHVEDGSGCTGTYTIGATPVAGSGPDGSTPPNTTIVKYIGFNEGNFLFNNAGVGQYEVGVELTSGNCANVRNKIIKTITIEDAPPSEDCDIPNPGQFTAEVIDVKGVECPSDNIGFAYNGSFAVKVADGAGCSSELTRYTISVAPVAGSGPDGSTPPSTTIIKYIGFGQGTFYFGHAGVGQYEVEVENTAGSCNHGRTIVKLMVIVPDALPAQVDEVEDMIVCPDVETEPVVFSSESPETLFKWTNDNPSIGLPSSGTGDIPSFIPQNPGSTYLIANIKVTPYFENNGCACNGEPVMFTITVGDNIAPEIIGLSATPQVLNPPNHKMRDVFLSYNINDASPATVKIKITVSSNEPENGTGDGDTAPDWEIVDNNHVRLRAERAGNGDGRIYTVTITATDECGNTTTEAIPIVVAHNITGPVSGKAYKVGSTVNFTGTFWDKPGNSHTAKWIFDDKTTVKGVVTPPKGMSNGTVSGSYKFNSTGVYKVRMDITDQNGVNTWSTMNGDIEEIVVIYDPNGGYSFGGGWFYSDRGALVYNPEFEGKVSFGFNSSYFKTATKPKGETQFEFKAGNLEFNALNFEYLSISGNRAQFKGTGKIIGGISGVAFIMTVIDGDMPGGDGIDRIRMKIFNKTNGKVFYDNQPGVSDAADPIQKIGDNSAIEIVNPFKSGLLSVIGFPDDEGIENELNVMVYPNPAKDLFTVSVQGDNSDKSVLIEIIDINGKLLETLQKFPGDVFTIGRKYVPGSYILRAIQDDHYQQHVLIKVR